MFTLKADLHYNGIVNIIYQQYQVHQAQREIKPKDDASIFILDKRTVLLKSNKNIASLMKQEALQLATYKHPTLLQLVQPLIEDSKRIVFITEPVQGNITSFAQNNEIMQYCSSELDIKIHMLQLIEAISYLHSDAQIVHLNISPENIYITQNKWKVFLLILIFVKLSGLIFSQSGNLNTSNMDFTIDGQYPNLSFIAPEIVLSQKCTYKSDMFSLGILLLLLLKFKKDQRASDTFLYKFQSPIEFRNNIVASIESLFKQAFFLSLDESLQTLLQKLLSMDPEQRPTLKQLHQSEFFMDPQVQTLNHLKKLSQMDVTQQASFLKSVAKIFMKFEPQVVKKSILPQLMPMIIQEQLMPGLIQMAIEVTKVKNYLTKVEYTNLIWANIKQATTAQSMPAQSLYLLVNAIEDFYNYVEPQDIQQVLIPLYLKCLECNAYKLQEIALSRTDVVVNKVDYIYTKSKILPRLLQLCLDQSNAQTRSMAMVTLKKIHSVFDRNSVNEFILPTLDKMRKTQPFKQEYAEILYEMYNTFGYQMPDELIIQKLIPQLLPFLQLESLKEKDYQNFADLLKNLIQKVASNCIKKIQSENPTGKPIDFPPQNEQEQDQTSIFNQFPIQAQNNQNFEVFNQPFEFKQEQPQTQQLQQDAKNYPITQISQPQFPIINQPSSQTQQQPQTQQLTQQYTQTQVQPSQQQTQQQQTSFDQLIFSTSLQQNQTQYQQPKLSQPSQSSQQSQISQIQQPQLQIQSTNQPQKSPQLQNQNNSNFGQGIISQSPGIQQSPQAVSLQNFQYINPTSSSQPFQAFQQNQFQNQSPQQDTFFPNNSINFQSGFKKEESFSNIQFGQINQEAQKLNNYQTQSKVNKYDALFSDVDEQTTIKNQIAFDFDPFATAGNNNNNKTSNINNNIWGDFK